MDGTVCMCPVHRPENDVCLLSCRGWIQEMSGDTSSCLGEWVLSSPNGVAEFLVLLFRRGVRVQLVFLPPLLMASDL